MFYILRYPTIIKQIIMVNGHIYYMLQFYNIKQPSQFLVKLIMPS